MGVRPRTEPTATATSVPTSTPTPFYTLTPTPTQVPTSYANADGLSDLDGNTYLHLYSDLDADTHKHANSGPNSDQHANNDSHLDTVALADANPYFHLHALAVPDSD